MNNHIINKVPVKLYYRNNLYNYTFLNNFKEYYDIEYYYNDIVNLAVKMGSIDPNPSDQLRSKVEQNYWLFMANIIMSFEPKQLKS